MSDSKVIESLKEACKEESGILTIVRIDNYEELSLMKDVAGDAVTKPLRDECISLIDAATEGDYIKAYLGEDEFVIFFYDIKNKKNLAEIYFNVVKKINESVSDRVSSENEVYVEISMGAAMVPEQGDDYETLFSKADRALEYVSTSGGHNIAFYDFDDEERISPKEYSEDGGAMWLEERDFRVVYDYMTKYIKTYKKPACEMSITFSPYMDDIDIDVYTEMLCQYVEAVKYALRESDTMTLIGNTIYLLLPEMSVQFVPGVLGRIRDRISEVGYSDIMDIKITSTMIGPERENTISINVAV